jgi:excinuclease ABC subunit B
MFTSGEVDLSELGLSKAESEALIAELTAEMLSAAEALEFERAAELRDRIRSLS